MSKEEFKEQLKQLMHAQYQKGVFTDQEYRQKLEDLALTMAELDFDDTREE